MKKLLLLPLLALAACSTPRLHRTTLWNAPSDAGVRKGIEAAQGYTTTATTAAGRLDQDLDQAGAGVKRAQTKAERIDAKAGVFLRYWGK